MHMRYAANQWKSDVSRHSLEEHSDDKQHKCDICSKSFYFKRHLRSHTCVKPYQCNVYNKFFSKKKLLTMHSKVHCDDKIIEM